MPSWCTWGSTLGWYGWRGDGRHDRCGAWEIERRPRGASRATLAPTFVSGQLFLWDLRANALAHGSISRRTKKAVACACHRRYWPKTNVGASVARDAPRGWRSVSQAPHIPRRTLRSLVPGLRAPFAPLHVGFLKISVMLPRPAQIGAGQVALTKFCFLQVGIAQVGPL